MGQKLADTEEEFRRRVDEVLHYLWDPIGVAYSPVARDEYQYVPNVLALLQEGAGASSLSTYLDAVATERMGLQARSEHSKRVAQLLLEWKAEIYPTR